MPASKKARDRPRVRAGVARASTGADAPDVQPVDKDAAQSGPWRLDDGKETGSCHLGDVTSRTAHGHRHLYTTGAFEAPHRERWSQPACPCAQSRGWAWRPSSPKGFRALGGAGRSATLATYGSYIVVDISTLVQYHPLMWSALFLTLPTQPNAVRLRVWRALKTLGCGSLRDGVYVLPEAHAALFDPLLAEVSVARRSGQRARAVDARRCPARRSAGAVRPCRGLRQWRTEAQSLAVALPALEETEARRRWRGIAEALQALRRIDYYPGAAAEQAQAELDDAAPGTRRAFLARRAGGAGGARHPAPGPAQVPGQALGHARTPLGRPPGLRLADPPLHRPRGTFRLAAPTRPARRLRRAARWASTTTAPASRTSARASASRCWRPASAWTPTRGCSASRVPCTSSTSAASRCPRPPGWRPCCRGLREVHADDDQLAVAAAAVFDALYAAPGTPA